MHSFPIGTSQEDAIKVTDSTNPADIYGQANADQNAFGNWGDNSGMNNFGHSGGHPAANGFGSN